MNPKESRETRIKEITNAAMEVFLEKGYQNATMEEIAKKTGMSKGGLYHHFKSKDIILLFVNQKISQYIEGILYKSLEMHSVKEGILFYIENYLKYWLEHPKETSFLFLSITKILEDNQLLKYYQQFTGDYMNFFEEAFQRGIQAGELVQHDTKTSSLTLVAALDGIICYLMLDDELKLDEVIKHFESKFITPLEIK
jgi:AcrR family transcriptional regulator